MHLKVGHAQLTLLRFPFALLGASGGGGSSSGSFLLRLLFRFAFRLLTLLLLLFLPLGLLRCFLLGLTVLRFSRQLDRLGRVMKSAVDLEE